MGEICLSVAPILRCQSLTRLEAGILLIPPGFEVLFACALLWAKRASADKKHVFLSSEICVYFLLAVLDVLTHTLPSIGTSLESFRSLDITIGAGSFIPLFLYTLFLYLLTTTELVPSLPTALHRITRYLLLAFIPLILLLNELGSFVGISYRSFRGLDGRSLVLGVGFTDPTPEVILNSATLVLLTVFQAVNFCVAFVRLVKVLLHKRTIETNGNEKAMETHLFRGLGWIVVGMKLGAIETVIGFAQGGFPIAFTRRLLRFIAHACLIVGVLKGVDTVEGFQLYSPSEAQRRRKSMLRAMIQNPRFSTFRHVGGHDFDPEKTFAPKRESVIKLGDPSWMRRDFSKSSLQKAAMEEDRATPGLTSARKSSSLAFKLPSRFSIKSKISSRKSKASTVRDSTSSFGSSKRNSWPPARDATEGNYKDEENSQGEEDDVVAAEFSPISHPAYPRPVRQRVTVHIRKDRLPVLQLRRFSNLDFLDLITSTDPFRDPHGRALSLPGNFNELEPYPVGHVSASFTRLPAYAGMPTDPPAPAVGRAASVRESVPSHGIRSMSVSTYHPPGTAMSSATAKPPSFSTFNARDSGVSFYSRDSVTSFNPRDSTLTYGQPPSAMSFHAIGTPAQMDFYVTGTPDTAKSIGVPDSASANTPRFLGMSRQERGLSSSTTASQVHALTEQFPGIPMHPVAVPRVRSMLSQEVPLTDSVVAQDTCSSMPPDYADAVQDVKRVPSVKRKPIPALHESEASPDKMERVNSEDARAQVITEQEATQSLPTPVSPPHGTAGTRWPIHRARSPSTNQKKRPPPLDLAPVDAVALPSAYTGDSVSLSSAQIVPAHLASGGAQGTLVRVKSVGRAPQRSVSASRRTAFSRDSFQAELGHVTHEMGAKNQKMQASVMKHRAGVGRGRGLPANPRLMPEAVDTVRWSVFNEA
ncbi:hypothetical protein BD414DRAFT_486330 [Trametes punicea]|nr:hypothetical protein BD414DRAFT_486330 [Trametes punicea]